MDVIGVYDTVTGRKLSSLPAASWSWRRRLSGSGSLSVRVEYTEMLRRRDLRNELAPWRTTLAVVDSRTRRVVAAGVVYQRRWDEDEHVLDVVCADLWDLLKLRLVLPPELDSYSSGSVLGGDQKYTPPWSLTLTGSLADIARDLVETTLQAGELPVILPPRVGGESTRTYQVPDFATVASRLSDLTKVIAGPEMLFQPRLVDGSTSIVWHMLTGSPELRVSTHRWDLRRRALPLVSVTVDEDASDMISDSWARGGAQDDATLVAHHHDMWLEDAGWPLLQGADKSHSSVSEVSTLEAYAQAATVMRSQSMEVVSIRARRLDEAGCALGDDVTPGDHIHLRLDSPYLGRTMIPLKALEVAGDEGEWVTVACREIVSEEAP